MSKLINIRIGGIAMATKAQSPKKKVIVRKTPSPKVVERKTVENKTKTPKFKEHKIAVYKKVQTAEGWKRSMLSLRKARLAKPAKKS